MNSTIKRTDAEINARFFENNSIETYKEMCYYVINLFTRR